MHTQQAPFLVVGPGHRRPALSRFLISRSNALSDSQSLHSFSMFHYSPIPVHCGPVQSSWSLATQLTQSLLRSEIDWLFIPTGNCENIQILCPAITHSQRCDFFEPFLKYVAHPLLPATTTLVWWYIIRDLWSHCEFLTQRRTSAAVDEELRNNRQQLTTTWRAVYQMWSVNARLRRAAISCVSCRNFARRHPRVNLLIARKFTSLLIITFGLPLRLLESAYHIRIRKKKHNLHVVTVVASVRLFPAQINRLLDTMPHAVDTNCR